MALQGASNFSTKEQRQKQILKLEEEIKKLEIEKRENEKLVKMKAQSDSKITKLNRLDICLID